MDENSDLRDVVAAARSRGSEFAVMVVRRRWSDRTTFGQRVRIRGSLVARYIGPTADGSGTLVDVRLADAERWLARQARATASAAPSAADARDDRDGRG